MLWEKQILDWGLHTAQVNRSLVSSPLELGIGTQYITQYTIQYRETQVNQYGSPGKLSIGFWASPDMRGGTQPKHV